MTISQNVNRLVFITHTSGQQVLRCKLQQLKIKTPSRIIRKVSEHFECSQASQIVLFLLEHSLVRPQIPDSYFIPGLQKTNMGTRIHTQ